jgi:hypothetical protein
MESNKYKHVGIQCVDPVIYVLLYIFLNNTQYSIRHKNFNISKK